MPAYTVFLWFFLCRVQLNSIFVSGPMMSINLLRRRISEFRIRSLRLSQALIFLLPLFLYYMSLQAEFSRFRLLSCQSAFLDFWESRYVFWMPSNRILCTLQSRKFNNVVKINVFLNIFYIMLVYLKLSLAVWHFSLSHSSLVSYSLGSHSKVVCKTQNDWGVCHLHIFLFHQNLVS